MPQFTDRAVVPDWGFRRFVGVALPKLGGLRRAGASETPPRKSRFGWISHPLCFAGSKGISSVHLSQEHFLDLNILLEGKSCRWHGLLAHWVFVAKEGPNAGKRVRARKIGRASC